MTASILYLFGALLTAFAPNFPVLVVGRFIFGIGIGLVYDGSPFLLLNLLFSPDLFITNKSTRLFLIC